VNTGDFLDGPEYFNCEKMHCKLRVDICIGRQKANKEKRSFKTTAFPMCEGCKQGSENWRAKGLDKELEAKPRRGQGKRNEHCELYSACLTKAAIKGWKTFNCGICPLYGEGNKVVAEKEKNTCEECGERPTISPKHPLCPVCLAAKSNEKQASKRTGKKAVKKAGAKRKESVAPSIDKGEKPQPRGDLELVVDFGKYGDVLKVVEALAEDEVRPVESQVIYILKRYLAGIKQ